MINLILEAVLLAGPQTAGAPARAPPELPVALRYEETFVWPAPPPEFPRLADALAEPNVPQEVLPAGGSKPDLGLEVGEALFIGPEVLLDRLVAALQSLAPRSLVQVLPRPGDEGVHGGILDFHVEPRSERPFRAFLHEAVSRERRYFSRFEDSAVATVGFESGTEDVDLEAFESDQEKILWDALRNVYLSKYRFQPEERIRDGGFAFGRWRGLDFALLPPLIGSYLWVRGLEKRFSLGGTSLRVSIEPLSRWAREDDLEAGAAFEWAPFKDSIFSLVVLTGLEDGSAELEFIGIGTSYGMARRSIELQREE